MLMSLLLKSEWNLLGKCTAYYLKVSRYDVVDMEDKEDNTYIQKYLFAVSTKSIVQQPPPKATQ